MDIVTYDEPTYSLRRLTLTVAAVIAALAIASTWTRVHEVAPPLLGAPAPRLGQLASPAPPAQRAAAHTAPAPPRGCFATADSADRLIHASGHVPVCVLQWRAELRHQRALDRQPAHRCYSTADAADWWIKHSDRLPGCSSSKLRPE